MSRNDPHCFHAANSSNSEMNIGSSASKIPHENIQNVHGAPSNSRQILVNYTNVVCHSNRKNDYKPLIPFTSKENKPPSLKYFSSWHVQKCLETIKLFLPCDATIKFLGIARGPMFIFIFKP